MQIKRDSLSDLYKTIDMKDFSIRMMIAYPHITPTIEAVDRIMKKFAPMLEGEQRLEFEDNCLERIDELLQKEKEEEFHESYSYEKHSVLNAGWDSANFKAKLNN